MAGPTLEQIIATLGERRKEHGPELERMRLVRDAYNNDLVIPLPELDRSERSTVLNLVNTGLDQLGARIGGFVPDIYYPPLRFGIKQSEDRAAVRRRANLAWWQTNSMGRKLRRRARHLIGYATSPVLLRPDGKRGIAKWETRSPLSTYPCPTGDPDDFTPTDCIFTLQRSYGWLQANYPTQTALLATKTANGTKCDPAERFDIVEYVDGDCYVLAAVGKNVNPMFTSQWGDASQGMPFVELERIPNRTQMCPAVVPGRITLDRPLGQFDGMIGMYQTLARLTALEIIAVEKGIFPETYLISRPNETARFLAGPFDGRTGQVNIVAGGDIKDATPNPGFASTNMADRIENAARGTAGVASEFGGECVDETTEILTRDGWKHYADVPVGELVLTLNHETGMAEWQPVLKMNVHEATARPMIEMEGPRFSALSTLNHRWPVLKWDGQRVWKNSPALSGADRIPIAAVNADLPTEAKYSDALVEAVAWYYTEGHRRPSGAEISQSTKKAENVERIRACLTGLFGPRTTERWRPLSGCGQGGVGHDGVPRWDEYPADNAGVIKFRLSAHAALKLDQHAPDKVPTFDFLTALTAAQLELFLRVSMLADNCGASRFGQKDSARTEAFAFAAILAGRGVSYRERTKVEARPGWRPGEYHALVVRLRERRYAKPKENAQRGASTFREVTHDGVVWCPTTPNGSWFARRNGSAYFTGNSPTNVRTGKRGDAVMSALVDMPVQEAQEVLAASLVAENRIAVAISKTYFGSQRKSFFLSGKEQRKGPVDYIPNRDFETDENVVTYPMAGADQNAFIIGIGQRLGAGLISAQTAQEMDPFIHDPQMERERVTKDAIERSLLQSVEAQATQGVIAPNDLARIMQLVATGTSLADAVIKVQAEAQARQATAAPAGAPETQPGLAAPGAAGAEQPEIQPPSAGQQNLSDLLNALRRPQRESPAERGAA